MCPCIPSCCLDLLPEASIIFIICSSFFIICISLLYNSRNNVEKQPLKHIYTDIRLFLHILKFYITTMLSKEIQTCLKVATFFSSWFLDFFEYFLLLNHLITICHDNICSAFVQIKRKTMEMFSCHTLRSFLLSF